MSPRDLQLDPAVLRWLKRIDEHSATLPDLRHPGTPSGRLAAARLSDLLALEFTADEAPEVRIDEISLPGPAGPLRVRRYRPPADAGALPTQLFLHGGGFIHGTVDELLNDRLCARRARSSELQVLSLDYRLAPEDRFPAGVEDAVAAIGELAANPAQHGVDPERLGIGGNSAGASIAAGAAIVLRDRGGPALRHQLLEVPDGAASGGESARLFAEGFGLGQDQALMTAYLGPGPVPPWPPRRPAGPFRAAGRLDHGRRVRPAA